jgi:hypothetical protein
MSRITAFTFLVVLALALAPSAEARKSPGNPLPAPNLVSATQLGAGEAECDGNTLTTDDLCVEIVFTKVCAATKYPVEVAKGFDTDGNGCDDAKITDDSTVPAEACTGVNNCLGDTAECQTADVPLGTTSLCVDDGDGIVDCVNDPGDVLVEADSVCTKLKAINPPKPGRNAVSQSTPFSNTICSDPNDECQ